MAVSTIEPRCCCARHADGSVTTSRCPVHAEVDPCLTMSWVTGRRRTGTIRHGVCTACGHTMRCHMCHEKVTGSDRGWIHAHGDIHCGTGDGSTAYPEHAWARDESDRRVRQLREAAV